MRLSHYFFNILFLFFFHFNYWFVTEKTGVWLNFLVQELSCLLTWYVAASRGHTEVQCHVPFLSNLFFSIFSHNRRCNRFLTFIMRKTTTRLLSLKHCEATPKSYICMAPLLGHYSSQLAMLGYICRCWGFLSLLLSTSFDPSPTSSHETLASFFIVALCKWIVLKNNHHLPAILLYYSILSCWK